MSVVGRGGSSSPLRARSLLTLFGPQSRFGDYPLNFQVVCLQNETAVLKGILVSVSCPLYGKKVSSLTRVAYVPNVIQENPGLGNRSVVYP